MRYYFDTSLRSSEFSVPMNVTGDFGIGSLEISHRITCRQGYCGDCRTLCSDAPASTCSPTTTNTTGLYCMCSRFIIIIASCSIGIADRSEDIMDVLMYVIGGLCIFIVLLLVVTIVTVCVCMHRRMPRKVTGTYTKYYLRFYYHFFIDAKSIPKFSNLDELPRSTDVLVQSRLNHCQHSSPPGDHDTSRPHSVYSAANDSSYYASLSNDDAFYQNPSQMVREPQKMHSNPAYSRSQTSLNQVGLTIN